MLRHLYKNKNNSDVSLSEQAESIILDIVPDETLVTEDIVCKLYDIKRASKPSEYPSMSRSAIVQRLRLLTEKKFLKAYEPFELRKSLKLGR